MITVTFVDGTLVLRSADGQQAILEFLADLAVWDPRIAAWRASAHRYAAVMRLLHGRMAYQDKARQYQTLELHEAQPKTLRPYQRQALAAWQQAKRCGVVVLPTGAGKSYVAVKAMLATQRSTLILAPTIDLVQQWRENLSASFAIPIGQYGGGEKDLQSVTVATYDSGVMIMPHYGNRFGLLICDECHHLPSGVFRQVADCAIAPFRMGLTATPERADGGHALFDELLGPEVYRAHITDLEGSYLAQYQVEVLEVPLDAEDAAAYHDNRQIYLQFIRSRGINFSRPDGWQQFIAETARDPNGRAVMQAYREQKRISRASRAKLRILWQLLVDHAGERCLIFTDDNATAYAIGEQMILPVLTHHTRSGERKQMLQAFRSGELPVLVTSKVLNEGVDVPEAAVGIVVSGSGSVREHVQRLGRILRPSAGKVAQLYELISAGTAEAFTSERRRSHVAFGEVGEGDGGESELPWADQNTAAT